jgi:AcrR family transcriptional regulator
MTTKEKILQESMKLFSIQGFDSVSVRKIAEEVGVRDSALYKHFKSKQAIFDALVEESKERFFQKYEEIKIFEMDKRNLKDMCLNMFRFQTENPWITMFRRMLILEQFKNPKMAEIYKNIFVDMPIQNQSRLFQTLIDMGVMADKNAEVMAVELYAPFFLYHTIEEDKQNLEILLKKHVENFIENYLEEEKIK